MKKLIFILFIFLVACAAPSTIPTPTPGPPTAANTSTPSVTPTFAPSPTVTFTPTVTPIPDELTDDKGVSMRLVPAGEFTMGTIAEDALPECKKYSNDCVLSWFSDEEPQHIVDLNAFYMDVYEVTNALYRACVDAGSCTPPIRTKSSTRFSYYGDSQYDNYPVINVNWDQVKAYCEWRGASLPTEAQWEKAARGTDGRIYPWGEGISCDQANYHGSKNCIGDTTEVGSYESGKSPYGMYDMAGNVWEWAADWYDEEYYANSPLSNPLGPDSGKDHLVRGGSWDSAEFGIRSVGRSFPLFDIIFFGDYVGFRCARDVTP